MLLVPRVFQGQFSEVDSFLGVSLATIRHNMYLRVFPRTTRIWENELWIRYVLKKRAQPCEHLVPVFRMTWPQKIILELGWLRIQDQDRCKFRIKQEKFGPTGRYQQLKYTDLELRCVPERYQSTRGLGEKIMYLQQIQEGSDLVRYGTYYKTKGVGAGFLSRMSPGIRIPHWTSTWDHLPLLVWRGR